MPRPSFDAIADAKAGGAAMLFTPEVSGLVDRDRERAAANIHDEASDPVLAAVRAAAARAWRVGPSRLAADPARGRQARQSRVRDRRQRARSARATTRCTCSTSTCRPAKAGANRRATPRATGAVVVDTPVGALGVSICYDLRFPDLYRALTDAGATILAVPAAFTRPTGAAHWHVLLRARAIEGAAFVVAAAQTGVHAGRPRDLWPFAGRSIRGARCCSIWARRRGWALPRSIRRGQADVRARVPALRHRRPIPRVERL